MIISDADKVLIGSTLFLGAVAIFGPALADQFKAWWLAAALRVDVNLAPPDCHLTTMMLRLSPAQVSKAPAYVYRIRVTNTGRSLARKCEVVVESLAIADAAGHYVALPAYTPVRLVWGAGHTDFVDINPDRHFFCDLFKVPAAEHQTVSSDFGAYVDVPSASPPTIGLVLDVESVFFSQPNRLPPGKFKLELGVHSENAPAVRKDVYIAWTGQWRDKQDEMFRECVISSSPAT